MVADELKNWRNTFSGPVWTQAFDFIESLTPDAPEGYTHLQGDDLFARVMTYDTRGPEDGILESHRNYIDIQAALHEAEGVDWFPRHSLEIKTPYNADNDAEFYHRPAHAHAPARVDVHPGMFVVLFPEDAHMAQQIVGGTVKHMRKVVVKVRLDLVTSGQA